MSGERERYVPSSVLERAVEDVERLAEASQMGRDLLDLDAGVIRALEVISGLLDCGTYREDRVQRARGIAEGVAWCLRGASGTLPEPVDET